MKKMKANKKFRENEEAVSAVIGTILMVAITVVLAAVIGAFVFGIGAPEPAPDLRFVGVVADNAGLNETHDNVTMTAIGTAVMPVADLTATVRGVPVPTGDIFGEETIPPAGSINAGETIRLAVPSGTYAHADSVRVVIVHVPTGYLLMDTTVIARA